MEAPDLGEQYVRQFRRSFLRRKRRPPESKRRSGRTRLKRRRGMSGSSGSTGAAGEVRRRSVSSGRTSDRGAVGFVPAKRRRKALTATADRGNITTPERPPSPSSSGGETGSRDCAIAEDSDDGLRESITFTPRPVPSSSQGRRVPTRSSSPQSPTPIPMVGSPNQVPAREPLPQSASKHVPAESAGGGSQQDSIRIAASRGRRRVLAVGAGAATAERGTPATPSPGDSTPPEADSVLPTGTLTRRLMAAAATAERGGSGWESGQQRAPARPSDVVPPQNDTSPPEPQQPPTSAREHRKAFAALAAFLQGASPPAPAPAAAPPPAQPQASRQQSSVQQESALLAMLNKEIASVQAQIKQIPGSAGGLGGAPVTAPVSASGRGLSVPTVDFDAVSARRDPVISGGHLPSAAPLVGSSVGGSGGLLGTSLLGQSLQMSRMQADFGGGLGNSTGAGHTTALPSPLSSLIGSPLDATRGQSSNSALLGGLGLNPTRLLDTDTTDRVLGLAPRSAAHDSLLRSVGDPLCQTGHGFRSPYGDSLSSLNPGSLGTRLI
eukprot:Hpha_TRINITY_DN10863_c0_g1::TRINITY_DN10863_c0_g1_i2::g.23518::m.23518